MTSLTLNLHPLTVNEDQFYQLCLANPDLRLERTAIGELVIMPPTGSETGRRNLSLSGQLWLWNEQHRLGHAFDSSTGFKLPNGAERSPDASWIVQERWDALTPEQKQRFAPICPDFVAELLSVSDQLEKIQTKMQEYMMNGARLGWLIDPGRKQVEIYRHEKKVEVLENPKIISGESVLPGFILNLSSILGNLVH